MSASLYRELKPHLSVFNSTGQVSAVTASRDVLAAIPGRAGRDIEQVITARQAGAAGRRLIDDIVGRHAAWLKSAQGPVYVVTVGIEDGQGLIVSAAAATVLIAPDATAAYRILDWEHTDPTASFAAQP